jgi:hypothetical protein
MLGAINKKTMLQMLFKTYDNTLVVIMKTPDFLAERTKNLWKKENFALLRKECIFFEEKSLCKHYNEKFKTIVHSAFQ